jgi:hypothetical protein
MQKQTLHFNLPHHNAPEGLLVHANLQDYSLQPHTPATRLRAGQHPSLLQGITAHDLTHYIEDLPLPASRAALVQVSAPATEAGQLVRQLLAMKINVPAAGLQAALAQMEAERAQAPEALPGPPVLTDFEREFMQQNKPVLHADPLHMDTAISLLFHHPNLLDVGEDGNGVVAAYIREKCIRPAIAATNTLPLTIASLRNKWTRKIPVLGEEKPDGSRDQMTDPDTPPGQPPVLLFADELHPLVKKAMEGPLMRALQTAQQSEFLRNRSWTVQPGVVEDASTGHPATGELVLRAGGDYKWSLTNHTPSSGLVINSNVRYDPMPNTAIARWHANGLWSDAHYLPEADRLTAALAEHFVQGRMLLRVTLDGDQRGILSAPLVPKEVKADEAVKVEVSESGHGGTTATFVLNDTRNGLTYRFDGTSRRDNSLAAALWVRHPDGREELVKDLDIASMNSSSIDGTLHVTCTNHWLRHLGAYVQFLDADDKVMTVPSAWPEQLPEILRHRFQPSPTKKFLDVLPPVNTICGIPIMADPVTLHIPVPRGAQTIRLLWGGLGMGEYDGDVCPLGIVLTSALELALPVLLLTAGTAMGESKTVAKLLADKRVLYSLILVAGGALGGYTGYDADKRGNSEWPLMRLANMIGPLLLKTALKEFIIRKFAEGTAARAIPILNVAFEVFSAVVTAVQLAQTTVAVLQSPFYYNTDIGRALDVEVELVPDKRFNIFPVQARRYRVVVGFDKGSTTYIAEGNLGDVAGSSQSFRLLFENLPAGGRLRVFAFFYTDSGWQIGQAAPVWVRAESDIGGTMLHVRNLQVIENEIPLTIHSVYEHRAKLAYQGGRHVWQQGAAPTATPATPSPAGHHHVLNWGGITLAQAPTALGYSWQGTGQHVPRDTNPSGPPTDEALYMVQSVSIAEDPERGYAAPTVGYAQRPGLVYDLGGTAAGEGRSFFVEPSIDGHFHLRRVEPKFNDVTRQPVPPVFPRANNQSWGCFPVALDRFVLHPQGKVIGVNYRLAKLFICHLPAAATTDAEAPRATLAAGAGLREGLMNGANALAVGLDGALLVLENNRIQAFDLYGNPVPYFHSSAQPTSAKRAILELTYPAGTSFLDLAVEAKGYLYVLTRRGEGRLADDYRVDIYTPAGELLVGTPRVAADKLTVALNRSMFTLNYETIVGRDGRPEPSVSQWMPPAPQA